MMQTVNISLPEKLVLEIDRQVEEYGYASRSEFFRALARAMLSFVPERANAKKVVFEKPLRKPLSQVRRAFEETGLYKKEFIDSLLAGMAKSSLYANKSTKERS